MTGFETTKFSPSENSSAFDLSSPSIQIRKVSSEEDTFQTLTPKELVEQNVRIKKNETIKLDHIFLDKDIIDEDHAIELGKSINKDQTKDGRGQLVPILVRAVIDNDEIFYDVIDGFHRTYGSIKENLKEIDAIVVYGCSEQELFDLRILAANSVKSVQFARLAQWINSSFETTEFSKKIDVCQAFALAINDSERSYIANFSQEEILSLKNWINQKASIWQRTPSSIYQDLRIISMSNPELVKKVRTVKGGYVGSQVITREKLKLVSERFPGEKNYSLQETILKYVNDHKLQKQQILNILDQIEINYSLNMSKSQTLNLIKKIHIPKNQEKTNKSEKKKKSTKTSNTLSVSKPEEINNQESLHSLRVIISEQKDELDRLKAENNELKQSTTIKDAIKYFCSWLNKPEYHLSDFEKKLIYNFLYTRENIFGKINSSNYVKIKEYLISAITKKITTEADKN